MDDDWGDWAAPEQVAAAPAPAHPPQQAVTLQNGPGVRRALDQSLFSALDAGEDEFGGFAAAPAPLPAQRADQKHHAAQQQEGQPALAKGDPAWLLDGRSNAWVQARVVSIDRTIHPPSYGVELPDGSYRETEAHRLLPRRPGAPPPGAASPSNGHHAHTRWAAAAASPFEQPMGGIPDKMAAAGADHLPAVQRGQAAVAPAAAAGDDEDGDFGDWAAAGAAPALAAPAATIAPAAGLGLAPVGAPAAPGSPRMGAAAHVAPSSAHGSPQRVPSHCSSAASSPVLDRFRSFLHAAAPQVSEQLELEEAAEERQAAAEQQRHEAYGSLQQFAAAHLPPSPRGGAAAAAAAVPPAAAVAALTAPTLPSPEAASGWAEDDFGSFEAAEPSPQQQWQQAAALPQQAAQRQQPQPQQPQPEPQLKSASAATPRGVQRDAPLPLDLFGEEPMGDGAANGIEPLAGPAATVAPAAAAAVVAQTVAAAAAVAAPAPAPAPPAAAVPASLGAAAAGTAGTAAGGSEWDDDFADFVSSPPAAAADAGATAGQQMAAAAQQLPVAASTAAASQHAAERLETEQVAAVQLPVEHVLEPAGTDSALKTLPAECSLAAPVVPDGVSAAADEWRDGFGTVPAATAGPAEQPGSTQLDAPAAADPAPPPPLPVPQQQPVSPSSAGSAGSRQSALLAALHPVSSAGSSARSSFEQPRVAAVPPQQQQSSVVPAVPLSAAALLAAGAGAAALAAPAGQAAVAGTPAAGPAGPGLGQELVQEYAVAWARLLEATAAQLQASAAVWAEAGKQGCWQELQQLPTAQQHLAACAQLYHAAAIVRLAAQQLGLFSLVLEVQEAWAQVEAAWLSSAPSAVDSNGSGSEADALEQQRRPAFRDVALGAWEAACPAGGAGSPAAAQGLLQSAAAQLQAMSPDDFPRMLAWSEGLCGLTLLPLSLFEGVLPVAAWEALAGRPCLVPLANLWLHRVSSRVPQLD